MTNDSDINDGFLDDDIPVVDSSGAKHVVHGTDFVDDGSAPQGASSAPAAVAPASSPVSTKDDMALGINGVPDEVKAVAESARFQEMLKGADVMEVIWGRMADESVKQLHLDAEMHRRFRKMAELYFRDLRDSLETVSKMTMPIASGGMGMNDEQADEVMAILKAKNNELQDKLKTQTSGEKDAYLKRLATDSMSRAAMEAEEEKQELDSVYARVTNKAGEPAAQASQQPTEPRRIPVVNHDEAVAESGGESEVSVGSVLAGTPAGESSGGRADETVEPPANLPVEAVEQPKIEEKAEEKAAETMKPEPAPVPEPVPPAPLGDIIPPKPVQAPAPAPTPPPSPVQSPAMTPVKIVTSDKPQVSDIKAAPRLTGPVEELGQLNLADFRRLSKDPKEACLKIMDKVDILAEQSFEVKNRGVKAWQDSPVNRIYLDILRESLDGKPVSGVIEGREKEGKETLTRNEFDALMDLNRKLRFG